MRKFGLQILLLSLLFSFSWLLPASDAEASSCLTRNTLTALPNGSLAPVICNQYGQLYAVSVNSDGTQSAETAPSSLIVPVRYESPYLHRTAGTAGLTCTTFGSPTTYPIGQAVPLSCNQYGQLLVELSGGAGAILESTVANLPAGQPSGTIRIVTDGVSGGDCTVGGDTNLALCGFDGSTWISLGSGVSTLQGAFSGGSAITGANSLANAVQIGDGVTPICLYTDATLGPQVRPCTDANVLTIIPANFTWSLWDVENAAAVETIDPDAASIQGIYTYGTNYKPQKQIWFPAGALSTDGTQCAAPAEVTINSGSKRWTIICADNDASTIYGEVEMPDSWDGGTVTLMGSFIQTAADTANLNADVAMACRVDGDAINNTWGTEIAMDTALGGSNKIDTVTTAAITPNGTCTGAGTLLQFRYQIDATGTTTAVATLHHLGFKLTYSEKSRSS